MINMEVMELNKKRFPKPKCIRPLPLIVIGEDKVQNGLIT